MESSTPSLKTGTSLSKKPNALVRYATLFGIVILINLFIAYAIQVAYPEPRYEQFCPSEIVNAVYDDKESCVANGGQWNVTPGAKEANAYCDNTFTCNKSLDEVNKVYTRNVFIVFVVAGIALLAGSLFLAGSSLIASALSFAGILALIIGSLNYWSDMNDLLRLVVLGVALVTVLYLAWKKFQDE